MANERPKFINIRTEVWDEMRNSILTKAETMANETIFIKSGMKKLFMFAFNHKHGWLKEVWGDDGHLLDHLTGKWHSHCDRHGGYGSAEAVMRFIGDLDGGNQDKLFEYIIDNH
jgi:hypothetical protein